MLEIDLALPSFIKLIYIEISLEYKQRFFMDEFDKIFVNGDGNLHTLSVKTSSAKKFVGKNFCHFLKISSLFSDATKKTYIETLFL